MGGGGQNIYYLFIFFIRVFGYFKHIYKPYFSGGGGGGGIYTNFKFMVSLCCMLFSVAGEIRRCHFTIVITF